MKNGLIIIFISLLVSACNEPKISGNSSYGDNLQKSEEVDPVVTAKQMIKAHTSDKNIDAGQIFKSRCAICHGVKGDLGVNGAGDLTKSMLNLEERVAIIYHGKNTMTPFKGILTDGEIVELALYVALLRQE